MTFDQDGIASAVADAIEAIGQKITLRRNTLAPHNASVSFDVQVWATVRGYTAQELTDTVAQGDREVTISNRDIARRQWPGPPTRNDMLLVDGQTARILAVNGSNLAGVVVKFVMQVRGG